MTLDNDLLQRIAEALERLAPVAPAQPDLDSAEAFVWRADIELLEAGRQGEPSRLSDC